MDLLLRGDLDLCLEKGQEGRLLRCSQRLPQSAPELEVQEVAVDPLVLVDPEV